MNEVTLLQYDVDIKSSLQLSAADTTKCISVLEKYKSLDVTALMLKKNPQVAETIKRLRRYVGNTKEWNFTDEERVDFNEKASKIRKLADTIYKKFKVRKPIGAAMWQAFADIDKYISAKERIIMFNCSIHLQKLFDFPPNAVFWQGFLDEVSSFKEQTKSLSREELITLTEDVQPGKRPKVAEFVKIILN